MDKLFPISYRPTSDDLERMWPKATVAFDTNVLLRVYQFSPVAREQLLDAMKRLGDRLWIPHQVAKEFHHKREQVIGEQHEAFEPTARAFKALNAHVQELPKHHPSIDISRLKEVAAHAFSEATAILAAAKERQLSVAPDDLLRRLTDIVGDRFGKDPDQGWLDTRYAEGRQRYVSKIPPGYKDDHKREPEKFGDYVLWCELLDHAATTKRPVFFVTDDTKEDWWLEQGGRRIGPRRELMVEMQRVAGVSFHLYTSDQFMRYAQHSLGVAENPDVIDEAQEVSRSELIEQGASVAAPSQPIAGIPSGAATAWETATGPYVSRPSLIGDILSQQQRALVREALDAPSQTLAAAVGIGTTLAALQRANTEIVRNALGTSDATREAIRRISDDMVRMGVITPSQIGASITEGIVRAANSQFSQIYAPPRTDPPRELDEAEGSPDAPPEHDATAEPEQNQEIIAPDHLAEDGPS